MTEYDGSRLFGMRLRRAAYRALPRLCAGMLLLYAVDNPADEIRFADRMAVHAEIAIGEPVQGVRFLGALRLPSAEIAGLRPVELSGLAYSRDRDILFAVSDHGALFSYRPIFENGVLVDVRPLDAERLRNASGGRLRGKWSDSEGLDILDGDNGVAADDRLLVSFEHHARLGVYSPSGRLLETPPLPVELKDRRAFSGGNKALEAVAAHPEWGFITAPEWPLRNEDTGSIPLFSQDGAIGQLPRNENPPGAVVAVEYLGAGEILVLERAFSRSAGHLVINLHRAMIEPSDDRPGMLSTTLLFRLDSSRSWFLDNFEGLTRHRDKRFFMVSDDNESFFQSTLLWYFEILD